MELDSDADVQVRAEADDSESFKVLTDYACGKLYRFNVKTGERVYANMKRELLVFKWLLLQTKKRSCSLKSPIFFWM